MNIIHRGLLLILTLACLAFALSACAAPTPVPTPKPAPTEPPRITPLPQPSATSSVVADGETIMRMNCGGCHNFSRIEGAKKTSDQWDQTDKRMVRLSAGEHAALINYLAMNYKP
jgi:cytochrome c5